MNRPTRRSSSTLGLTGLAVLGLLLAAAGPGVAVARSAPWLATQTDPPPAAPAAGSDVESVETVEPVEPGSVTRPRVETAPATAAFDPSNVDLAIEPIAAGFSRPVLVTHAGDGSGRLFVVEQTGKIRIIAGGTTLATPFLDLEHRVTQGGERGLLGLAFHPSYPAAPYIYVNFTDLRGYTIINRYTVSSDPNVINPASGVRILTISQPYSNHKGGHLAFGPDGFLYIGLGDGGSAGDPGNRAQSTSSLLGKILRIGVNRASSLGNYAVPASNPYVGRTGLDQIWSIGLRNPWRWSFDRLTGQLWIADVGQYRYEEINRSSPRNGYPAARGANFGWNVMEGRACYKPSSGCSTSGKQMPVAVYGHAVSGDDNCSVTGGYVYRGSASPVLAGGYIFGDFCSGRIWALPLSGPTPMAPTLLRDATAVPQLSISSFGEDEAGELYVCDLGGDIYRLTATPKA